MKGRGTSRGEGYRAREKRKMGPETG